MQPTPGNEAGLLSKQTGFYMKKLWIYYRYVIYWKSCFILWIEPPDELFVWDMELTQHVIDPPDEAWVSPVSAFRRSAMIDAPELTSNAAASDVPSTVIVDPEDASHASV